MNGSNPDNPYEDAGGLIHIITGAAVSTIYFMRGIFCHLLQLVKVLLEVIYFVRGIFVIIFFATKLRTCQLYSEQ